VQVSGAPPAASRARRNSSASGSRSPSTPIAPCSASTTPSGRAARRPSVRRSASASKHARDSLPPDEAHAEMIGTGVAPLARSAATAPASSAFLKKPGTSLGVRSTAARSASPVR
jgi:hypothetical protein